MTERDRERVAKRVTAVAVALVVAGVVVAGLPSTRSWRLPTTATQDRSSWVMPLDQYIGVGDIRVGYAQELMIEKCRTDEGGDGSRVPWRDVDAATTAAERQPTRAFDLDQAEARGYHVPPTDDPGEAAWREFVLRPVSAAESAARDRCVDKLYSEHPELLSGYLGTGTGTVGDIATRLSDAAFRDARDDDAVLDTVPAWLECLQPVAAAGWELPPTPAGMPTDAMAGAFASSDPTTPVTEAELDVATADAACRESSGYLDALYDAEWEHQLTVPHDYGERLSQVDTGAVAAAKRTVAYALARLTPPAP
ncbi:hypothetical protein ABID92_002070 [Frigoribacterium sp. PvP120]|uniref:hypothetical protein n=1 Tax=unclassified Frigoribacterium TaxID=2627005 RepID=UPI001AE35A8F|nr:hypothetical protein [Frigoribacterium sp. PvP121]MBP1240372.1 hypothetical protein [Frigoribacterium sp. PvP121]